MLCFVTCTFVADVDWMPPWMCVQDKHVEDVEETIMMNLLHASCKARSGLGLCWSDDVQTQLGINHQTEILFKGRNNMMS